MPESLSSPAAPSHQRTIYDYVRVFLKRRWAFLSGFFIIFATAAIYSFIATPIFQASVQILIERYTPKLLDQREAAQIYNSYHSEEFYRTQYKLLESPAVVRKVVDKLSLQTHPYYAFIFRSPPAGTDAAFKKDAEEDLIKAVQKKMEVTPVRNRCYERFLE